MAIAARVARRFPRLRSIAISLLEARKAFRQREPVETRIAQLAAGPASRAKLRVVARWLSIRDQLPFWPARPIGLSVEFRGLRVPWRVAHTTDLWVLNEILVEQEYATDITPPEVVLDLGSHIGVSLLYFRAVFPGARIIGVEPDPQTCRLLRRNVTGLSVETYRYAITGADGPVRFFQDAKPWASSLDGQGEPIIVEGRSLDSLLDELGLVHVDLLKLDIEGAEHEAIRESRRLHQIAAIVGEFHGSSPDRVDAFLRLLHGFELETEQKPGHTLFRAERRCKPSDR
jgi:FkbM family methyltransferase